MNKNNAFFFVIFGIMLMFSIFTVYPQSNDLNLVDRGVELEGIYEVTNDWDNKGTLLEQMETDSEKIFVNANNQGTYLTDIQEGESFDFVNISGVANPTDGEINYSLRVWDSVKTSSPDQTFNGSIEQVEFENKIESLEQYDIFELEISMEETAGSNNERPNVESLKIEYVENLDRSSLGLNNKTNQLIILMTLIGSVIFALFSVVE